MSRSFRPIRTDGVRPCPSRSGLKAALSGSTALAGAARLAMFGLAGSMLAFATPSYALPVGGAVAAGTANLSQGANTLTVNQQSQNAVLNWQSFSIGQGEAVSFVQPSSSSVALNRVVGADPSSILGNLSANGKVFLVNPNGILFGTGAQVNVGGLVASTLNIQDADFMAGKYSFSGSGGSVVNRGSINADGGYVALLGGTVSNQGLITADLGSVVLAAGTAMTLDVVGDGLLNITVDEGAVNALVENGGMIHAHGGKVVLTAQAAGQLLKTVVNNTGVIEAQTLQDRNGSISLLGDMQSGAVNVSGTLDASAPNGGDGGSIETSAATVNVADGAQITTVAASGVTGTWLIDPVDFTIAPLGGNTSGATLSALLGTNSVIISTLPGAAAGVAPGTPPVTTETSAVAGGGDINVNDTISWTTPIAGTRTTLTLNAAEDVNIRFPITAVRGNLVVCCARDINVEAAITTTRGSVLLSAGRDLFLRQAMTTTNGNITLCAGDNVHMSAALTLTNGSSIPAESLGLALGLTIIAGNNGTGQGNGAGTLIIDPLTPPAAITGPDAPVNIYYNPPSYTAPTDYRGHFTLVTANLTEFMLVFPSSIKVFDGGTGTTLSGFNGAAPGGLVLVSGPTSTASFDSAAVGDNIGITFSGYTLAGPAGYALPVNCCVPTSRTRGSIINAVVLALPPTPAPTPAPTPTPVVAPTPTPTPVAAPTPTRPRLALAPTPVGFAPPVAGAVAGFQFAVLGGGVNMPVVKVVETQPLPVEQAPPPAAAVVVAPVPPAPKPYVAPVYPRKQGRN